jgi:hypothetical protein
MQLLMALSLEPGLKNYLFKLLQKSNKDHFWNMIKSILYLLAHLLEVVWKKN